MESIIDTHTISTFINKRTSNATPTASMINDFYLNTAQVRAFNILESASMNIHSNVSFPLFSKIHLFIFYYRLMHP